MELPDWVASVGKVAGGAMAGVWAGQRRLESRVAKLEEADRSKGSELQSHDKTLTAIHETVTADHDLLTELNTKMGMVLTALAVKVRT